MTIDTTMNGTEMTIALKGRLDSVTAPQLEQTLKGRLDGLSALTMDLSDLDYISSAGLRVLLSANKALRTKGGVKLTHVSEDVMDVLEITGFADLLNIE